MNSFVILVNLKPVAGRGEGWGICLVVTHTYRSGERRAANSGDPGCAQSPVSGLNGIPLKKS